jgi:hypothetical protein
MRNFALVNSKFWRICKKCNERTDSILNNQFPQTFGSVKCKPSLQSLTRIQTDGDLRAEIFLFASLGALTAYHIICILRCISYVNCAIKAFHWFPHNSRSSAHVKTFQLCISRKKQHHATTMVNLGDVFPDFEAQTNQGPIKFHEFLGNRFVTVSWRIRTVLHLYFS